MKGGEFIYKTITIPVKCNKTDYTYLVQCNKLSAEVWNYCVKLDQEQMKLNGKQVKFKDLQAAVKHLNALSSKNIQLVFLKYYHSRSAMWKSIKANHENSSKVKMPYREKKYFNTMWDYQAFRVDYKKGIILLNKSMLRIGGFGKRQIPVKCYAKSVPQNIVEIELLYRNGLRLAIKYKEPDLIQSVGNNTASIDLGEIHSIASIDNNANTVIITGRKLRSIKRLRDKELSKLRSKQSKCTKGSRQYKKYKKAMFHLKCKTDNKILDTVHKITKLYLDFCLKNDIGKVYYGNIDSSTRNTRDRGVKKHGGQKLNEWSHGLITLQLSNKLSRYGIQLIKVEEYFTSQKCPRCGCLNKTASRNYSCDCGYTQHRDIVGAINILNDNADTNIQRYTRKTYLRIA